MPTNLGTIETIEPSINDSVVRNQPDGLSFAGDYVLYMARKADEFMPWGAMPAQRDAQLRAFWHTEPILASAIFSTISRYAAFGWQLDGPKRLSKIYTKLLHSSEFGQGWMPFIIKVLVDLFTQDNGAFIEIVRTDDSPTAPVLGLNHLDSAHCVRTGRVEDPVIYIDSAGIQHKMKWYQIIPLSEFPSPVENMRGMQYCVVTRLLRAAQIMRDISVYKQEKISGRFTGNVWLVGGVQTKTVRDAIKQHELEADNRGLIRYIQPAIIGSLDPTATVSAEKLELASLPEGYDEEKSFRWYVNQLALAFGGDYQDYAPLPGGNLGTAQQSEVLHLKARAKGPRLFMSILEHHFNYHGIMPNTLTFAFGDQDVSEDTEKTKLKLLRAEERAMRIKSGEISPEVARQLAVESGDLDPSYIAMLEQFDQEEDQREEEQFQQEQQAKLTPKPPGLNGAKNGKPTQSKPSDPIKPKVPMQES